MTRTDTNIQITNDYLDEFIKNGGTSASFSNEALLEEIHKAYEEHNILHVKSKCWKYPEDIPWHVIPIIMSRLYIFKCIHWFLKDRSKDFLALYHDKGEDKGLYISDDLELRSIIRKFNPAITKGQEDMVISRLKERAPLVLPTEDKDLIPVKNGVFNYKTKKLQPFSPDYVFTRKCRIRYNANAKNITITMSNGMTWDVMSFIHSLSDDPEVRVLLWQVIGDSIRPFVKFDKIILPYNTKGKNGKSTYATLIENLVGDVTQLSFAQFAGEFMLESLTHSTCVVCHENSVKNFTKNAEAIKSCITGNKIMINRKNEKPVTIQFKGLIIECVNDFPRFADTSDSWYRRFLPIPFSKNFDGTEIPDLEIYLAREDVLEYVLYYVLNELPDYYEFIEPEACLALLNRYKLVNDPLRQFADSVIPELKWNFYPWELLYDLYVGWNHLRNPSGTPVSYETFRDFIKSILVDVDNAEWELKKERLAKSKIPCWEPLIDDYDIKEKWVNWPARLRNEYSPSPDLKDYIYKKAAKAGIMRKP